MADFVNIPINGQLTFNGQIAGQVTISGQPFAGSLSLQLPNQLPFQGQVLTATAVNGLVVALGWSTALSGQVQASQLAQSGAVSGQILEWNGTAWVPVNVAQTFVPVLAGSPPIPLQFLTGYNAVTGVFSAAQPNLSNIGGTLLLSQIGQNGATTGQIIEWNGSAWVPSSTIPGEGTVTSVALSVPAELSVAGSPITVNGTLALSWASSTGSGGQAKVIATPAGGGTGAYAGRVLVASDIPAIVIGQTPLTTLGDILYVAVSGSPAAPALARLVGNITTVKQYLSQTGTGTVSAAPAWAQIAAADLSNGVTGSGALVLANSPTIVGTATLPAASFTGLFTELNATGITAFAGGGQASATQLTAQTNRITTVANPGDSVKLPAAVVGLEVTVVNTGANYMGVFGLGTDTINGQPAATGILQPPNSQDIYVCSAAGSWTTEPGVGYSGSLFTELTQDGITAHVGGGQGAAFQIIAQTNRITTVTNPGDSIVLPPSAAGLELVIINHGANPMQVFGFGADTIDDVASAVGVSQMPFSFVIYSCPVVGKWYSDGLSVGFNPTLGLQTFSFASSLTAHAGGGQALATPVTTLLARFSTVASAGDSAILPVSTAGLELTVVNAGANAMNVYPTGTDQINLLGAGNPFSLAAGQTQTFNAAIAGQWNVPYVPSSSQTHVAYNVNSAPAPSVLTVANISGSSVDVTLNLTGLDNGATTATLPSASALFAAIPNAAAGQSYQLRIINSSSVVGSPPGGFTWTILPGTGWTITGAATIAANTWRDFYVILNSSTTATLQNVGGGNII